MFDCIGTENFDESVPAKILQVFSNMITHNEFIIQLLARLSIN